MFENKTMRNRELMADYKRVLSGSLSSGCMLSSEHLIKKMLVECRPRYDVTFDYAVRMMQAMVRDGKPCPFKGLKKSMWEEIGRHVAVMMEKRCRNLHQAVATVLAEKRASRYFLSYKQAAKIIFYEQHKNRSRNIVLDRA